MTTTIQNRRTQGTGDAADRGAGQCSAQARAVGAAERQDSGFRIQDSGFCGETQPTKAGLPVSRCRADEIILTYKSKVWTPTLPSRSKWRVLNWRASLSALGGTRTVMLENIKTGKRVSVTETVIRLSFAAKRQMRAIFATELERRAA